MFFPATEGVHRGALAELRSDGADSASEKFVDEALKLSMEGARLHKLEMLMSIGFADASRSLIDIEML